MKFHAQTAYTRRRSSAILAGLLLSCAAMADAAPAAPRAVMPLTQNWRFVQDDVLDDAAALAADGRTWQSVNLPHTWNARDAASIVQTTPGSVGYKRGQGWYRLEFDGKARPANAWLQFDGASIVADVWLNGKKLGEHRGAFTAFRFDVAAILKPGKNVLLVRADNSAAVHGQDRTAIAPLSGDFNMSGGLYRAVSLITTPARAHIALDDQGGPGVYAQTRSVAANGDAILGVRVKLGNAGGAAGRHTVHARLIDANGKAVRSLSEPFELGANAGRELNLTLAVPRARLWQGVDDPYLYELAVELRDGRGHTIDSVRQHVGIRQMRFDANEGFFLNGKKVVLHGVNLHQDFQDKAWAISDADVDRSMAIMREMGANAVRLAHYPHGQHTYDQADRLGLVVWAETPFVERALTAADCKAGLPVPAAFGENLEQQTREMVRQLYNHASIATWSVGNEVAMGGVCEGKDTVTPLLRRLHALVKQEDSQRVTTLADFNEDQEAMKRMFPLLATGGITDAWAVNRYALWYYPGSRDGVVSMLDSLHAKYPAQPLGVSEYGAGAAISHQTDNPLGGIVANFDFHGRSRTLYQPEGYASHVHEQVYGALASRPYLWGTFVWSMFDFGSGIRHEGDVGGTNTKGLVTFDRQTRKDPFYFYQANWRSDPVTHLTGKRYTLRAYRVADVKVYSNADQVELLVNGRGVASKPAAQCPLRTCLFEGVVLQPGPNEVVARGTHGARVVRDGARWTLDEDNARNLYLAAGQIATGFVSSDGHRYGSDNFFSGGQGTPLELDATYGTRFGTRVVNVPDPRDAVLWDTVRHGTFGYRLPLDNGDYKVTLGFLEPDKNAKPGSRVFDVKVGGATRIEKLDVLSAAGAHSTAIWRSVDVEVTNGILSIDFVPVAGEAVLSNLSVTRR
jgi:beta-galactosidase